jgi:hypothetical protein
VKAVGGLASAWLDYTEQKETSMSFDAWVFAVGCIACAIRFQNAQRNCAAALSLNGFRRDNDI